MPLLLGLFTGIGGFFASLFSQFVVFAGRKLAVSTAAVIAFIACTVAFIVSLKAILASLTSAIIIPAWIMTSILWFIPSNFVTVVSAILSAKIAKEIYRLISTKIDLVAKS